MMCSVIELKTKFVSMQVKGNDRSVECNRFFIFTKFLILPVMVFIVSPTGMFMCTLVVFSCVRCIIVHLYLI